MATNGPKPDSYTAVSEILIKYGCGKSVLQIGARPRGGWSTMKKLFFKHGCERHDILEIFHNNVKGIELNDGNEPVGGQIFEGNVLRIADNKSIQERYDWILWWYGPEHVPASEFRRVLPDLLSRVNIGIIIGCPFGKQGNTSNNENPYEEHVAHWLPKDLERLGFSIYTYGPELLGTLVGWTTKEKQ